MFYTPIKHGFLTNQCAPRVLSILAFSHSSVLNSPWCPKLMFRYRVLFTSLVNLIRCRAASPQMLYH